jgi:hypothetical protein
LTFAVVDFSLGTEPTSPNDVLIKMKEKGWSNNERHNLTAVPRRQLGQQKKKRKDQKEVMDGTHQRDPEKKSLTNRVILNF